MLDRQPSPGDVVDGYRAELAVRTRPIEQHRDDPPIRKLAEFVRDVTVGGDQHAQHPLLLEEIQGPCHANGSAHPVDG